MNKNKLVILNVIMMLSLGLNAQQFKKVLFLGNSYTAGDNLAELVRTLARSAGDSMVVEDHTPGGYRLKGHSTDMTSLNKIARPDWDYVVLQEQSQLPSFPAWQVQQDVFPYAKVLCDTIRAANSCAKPIFFMTWGRKNGDGQNCQFYQPLCTYEGMTLELRKNYLKMANDNDAFAAPVGMAWRLVRSKWPNIELYSSDGSHQSFKGSYLAACVFYAVIFDKDPMLIGHNANLSNNEADSLKWAAKVTVFDSLLTWNIKRDTVSADFSFVARHDTVEFSSLGKSYDNTFWDFGDGQNSSDADPVHIYNRADTFRVSFTADFNCVSNTTFDTLITSLADTTSGPIDTTQKPNFIHEINFSAIDVFPQPAAETLSIAGIPSFVQYIRIIDLKGKLWRELNVERGQNQISLSVEDLENGIYLLELKGHGRNAHQKIVVQH